MATPAIISWTNVLAFARLSSRLLRAMISLVENGANGKRAMMEIETERRPRIDAGRVLDDAHAH